MILSSLSLTKASTARTNKKPMMKKMVLFPTLALLFLAGDIDIGIGIIPAQADDITFEFGDGRDDVTSGSSVPEILLGVFSATGGLTWTERDGWFESGKGYCEWYGITCFDDTDPRREGQVQSIDWSNNHMVGMLPPLLWELPYLEEVNLRDNVDLAVDFSNIDKAQHLTYLAISDSGVVNLDGIGQASNLEYLHVTNLGLGGPFPLDICELTKLRALYGNFNNWIGTLPTHIGNLRALEELYLYENNLTGGVPSEIGYLTDLRILSLAQNAWGGQLPAELNQLTELETVTLHRVQGSEKGIGFYGPVPSFADAKALTLLDMQNNNLSGDLPNDFIQSAPTHEVVKVNLSRNEITGSVPALLYNIQYLQLNLIGNQINLLPLDIYNYQTQSCPKIQNWMGGDIASFGCSGFLCFPGTFAPKGRATAGAPCTNCLDAGDEATYFGRTSCTTPGDGSSGAVSNANERQILVEIYNRMGGKFWKESDKWLQLGVNICDWFGITCNSNQQVISISLPNNELSGPVPPEVFNLSQLQILNLNTNTIDMSFIGIKAATNLQALDLGHADISSLDGIEELASTNVQFLNLADNNLSGPIPVKLFTLTKLKELSISHNEFTGPIPTQIGNSAQLEKFGCSGNNLNGALPPQLGNLQHLKQLIMSENDFTGFLPAELGNLSNLETLSLHQKTSENGIGGPLRAFANMAQLTSLQLEYNELTGPLPDDLLKNTQRGSSERIEVLLDGNNLQGPIPTSWASRFDKLFLDVTLNRIVDPIDASICSKVNWMDGAVKSFSCDAIVCPPGTFSPVGRRTPEANCDACDSGVSTAFYGELTCGSNQGEEPNELDENDLLDQNGQLVILSNFFYATHGNEWEDNTGWTTSSNVCEDWYGITCDTSGLVTKIDLRDNGLVSEPGSDIFKLPKLKELYLSGNDIQFSFDEIENAKKLITLDVSHTNLKSVNGISKASKLANLYLSDNGLEGDFPPEILLLENLRELYMGYNLLSGLLPGEISNLSNLETLYLVHNRFSGQLSATLGELTNLKILHLAENNFDGTIPNELNSLTNLEFLSIQREGGVLGFFDIGINQGPSSASGTGLTGPLPAFDNLFFLSELYLGVNSLSGTIPYNLLNGLRDKSSDLSIDLTSNRLTGMIPPSLTQFENLQLFLAGNLITEIPPGLCYNEFWLSGAVRDYDCDAILCPIDTYNEIGRRTGDHDCMSCPAGTNGIMGSFECLTQEDHITNSERDILEKIYKATKGDSWIYKDNWLDPDESFCTWYGIQCGSDGEESVYGINLPNNHLANSLPTEIWSLPNLKELNVGSNDIAIDFTDIVNAQFLESLDIDNCRVLSLEGIGNAFNLKLLRVDQSYMTDFPQEVLSLLKLEVLSMNDNDFVGPIPTDLQYLEELVYFACGNCQLNGKLPQWIGSFQNLEYLRLDKNALTGPLPPELESLMNLKHLNLADQLSQYGGLTGNLLSFASQSQLTELLLQRNDFEGVIPSDFLQSVDKSKLVTIDIRANGLTGTLPSELATFQKLSFLAADNLFDSIPPELCTAPLNDGNTQVHGCNAVLCEKGTFNSFGRAVGDVDCYECDDGHLAHLLGLTYCSTSFERNVLLFLYGDTAGADWTNNDNWLSDEDHCTWQGITCYDENHDMAGYIKEINLEDNNLVGSTWAPLWQLEGVQSINLSNNDISISFYAMANAFKLKSLTLSNTNLGSITGISGAPAIELLHLTNAGLSGPIPEEIFTMKQLQELYMSHNTFTGTLSTKVGDLVNLRDLYLFDNDLDGDLPSELGLIFGLEHLSLGKNDFAGSVPDPIMSLPSLQMLSLQETQLTGPLPSFSGLKQINELYLASNSFEGLIPDNFLVGVENKNDRVVVDLVDNLLGGSIPDALAAFDKLNIYLAGNEIENISSDICAKGNWMNGEVASDCTAILCEPGTYNDIGRSIGFDTVCEVCTYPNAAQFYGSTSCGPRIEDKYDLRTVLFELYDATGGDGWTNNASWKNDNIPVCDWFGVTCEVGKFGAMTITELSLESNNLIGIIPAAVFHLSDLRRLNVRNNPVSMTFNGIWRANNLQELYLDGTRVTTLDGIGKADALTTLHLHGCSFGWDEIHDEIFDLNTLQDLDLSEAMFAGTLSTRIGELSSLQTLRLNGNDLTGQLPSEIGNLVEATSIILYENDFFGTLPESISNLVSLQSFNLDNSKRNTAGVSGPLPPFATMPNLNDLRLGSNQLTGTIPEHFLSSVNDLSVTINVDLSSNHLVGTIPSSLGRFAKLNIDLTDNLLEGIGSGLCEKAAWQDGTVGVYSCDAILCPPGQYSVLGRQASDESECVNCPGAELSSYWGLSTCQSIQKQHEKEILVLLYNSLGGDNWKKNDGWLDDSVDICNWYGISCFEERTVESIILGSNNLIGIPPKELFELPNLKYLWLYSNPIQFSFEGIENAKKLINLLLDSTGLESIKGIGKAESLTTVDVRFNNLSGRLPDELQNLRNLESFTCSDNELNGPVPPFLANRKLNTLRMGNNNFVGSIPTFAKHQHIQTLDLSENKLVGTIPDNIFEIADTTQAMFLDLSSNKITGSIPVSLTRFEDLTLYLRNNQIEGFDPSICARLDWNGGDVASFSCDGILCPSGTYSPTGRASKDGAQCLACDDNIFFGSTTCGGADEESAASISLNVSWWFMTTTTAAVMSMIIFMVL